MAEGVVPIKERGSGWSRVACAATFLAVVVMLNGCQAVTTAKSNPGPTTGSLMANPTSVSFGNVQVGSSQAQSVLLSNSGGSSVTVSQATATGGGFSVSGLNLPIALNAGQSVTFSVGFAPQSGGSATGSITVQSTASNPNLILALSGTGTSTVTTRGLLAISPSTINFGNVVVGTSATQPGSLSASAASVTISGVSSTNPEFTVSGISFPLTLAAGNSAPFSVKFTPQASGAASATISVASNASNSPPVESVSGTGTPPPQHSVDLSWAASTSVVVGYNVYRGALSGGPYTIINPTLEATTSYTDASVQAGQTYYYVVAAVDSSGNQSNFSNQVQAVIPTP